MNSSDKTLKLVEAERNVANSLYSRLGGELVLREFVNHLYDFMASSVEVEHIRKMHSKNLSYASDRLFMFLSGMLGGPPLYIDAFGPPHLRRKHLHFKIGDEERDQWMMCAQYAADHVGIEANVRDELMLELTTMVNHLRNQGANDQQCGGSDVVL